MVKTSSLAYRPARSPILLGLNRGPPPVYQGRFGPHVLFKAFLALHDVQA